MAMKPAAKMVIIGTVVVGAIYGLTTSGVLSKMKTPAAPMVEPTPVQPPSAEQVEAAKQTPVEAPTQQVSPAAPAENQASPATNVRQSVSNGDAGLNAVLREGR